MRPLRIFLLISFGVLASVFSLNDFSEAREGQRSRLTGRTNPLGLPISTKANINNISAWYDADGVQERNSSTGNAGLTYPRGTATAIFASGLMWGGEYNDGLSPVIRVNGHSYNTGMTRGAILGIRTGIYEDPDATDVRIWRIRRDYATADLILDAAEMNLVLPSEVTEEMIAALRAQYETDWLEWPAHKGAPFYDSDGNGIYSPVINGGEPVPFPEADEPGLANADQVVWYVCNDLPGVTPWGATPSPGIEQQGTIWGYNQSGVLGDVLFKRFRLIYKGRANTPEDATIENMYIAHWSDPDLGSFADDYAGCDTVLNMGFVYNWSPVDFLYQEYGLAPPSFGFDFFQGPLVNTGNPADTAIFDLQKISGAINLPMTSFVYFAAGGSYSDPSFNYSGALQWNCMFQGLPPTPQPPPCPSPPIDPFTGNPSGPFWLYEGSDGISAPDIFSPNGWVDGMIDSPGDRRFVQSSGPITMAIGDTQEVLVAGIGGSANSYLASVSRMKAASQNAQTMYNWLFTTTPPTFSVSASFPNHIAANLLIVGDGNDAGAAAMSTTVNRRDGNQLTDVILFDDGTHGDLHAGDGLFTNSVFVVRDDEPYFLSAIVEDGFGRTINWTRVHEGVATVGEVVVSGERIFSDNLNNDGIANPGENIRFGFTTRYEGISTLSNFVIAPENEPERKTRVHTLFADGSVDSMIYDPDQATSYFSVNVPTNAGSIFEVPVVFTDSLINEWRDTIYFQVEPFSDPVQGATIAHPVGTADGDFEVLVVDHSLINDHLYVIEGISEPDSPPAITLRDSSDGRVLLENHPIPDAYGHNMPVTDGFKVMIGTIDTTWGWENWSVPQGNQVWTAASSNYLQLEGFDGAMGPGYESWYSGSTVPLHRLRDVLIVFAATDVEGGLIDPNDTTASFAYRYIDNAELPPVHPEFAQYIINPDTGISYQDFHRMLPFAAYDVNAIPPRRLAVGFTENNVNCGLIDGKYWPPYARFPCFLCGCNSIPNGAREFFFIFDIPYAEVPDPMFEVDVEDVPLPLMWWGTPGRNGDVAFQTGDQFMIEAAFPFSSQDVWTFNPTITGVNGDAQPASFRLSQNYPNPFNPSTTIAYEVPATSIVSLIIYDILGREVRTLVNDVRQAGPHKVLWNSTNKSNLPVASGVYFYRLNARSLVPGSSKGGLVETRKMIVIK